MTASSTDQRATQNKD